MFLRRTQRKKDGKTHSYWNIVESKRLDDGRVVQRQVLYLGEINSSQAEAWRKAIEVFDEDAGRPRTLALFAAEPVEAVPADDRVVRVHLSELRLYRPRQWGACWLAGHLWRELELDRFWKERLAPSRKGTRWDQILQVLVSYRLIAPGSEWKLHRDWFGKSAMADVLGGDFGLAEAHKLYACHDRLLEHKDALFAHLVERWRTLFSVEFDVLLYDLTSTYFEVDAADLPDGDKRRHGYSRDKRPDCPQVVIALVVTPEGLPLAYEVLPGNTADNKTLRTFLEQDRGAVRQGPAGLGDGPRHPDRRSAGRDAAAATRPCSIWSERPRAASPDWKSTSRTSRGKRFATGSRSNCWLRTMSFTSSPRVPTGSPRSAPCAGGT